MPEEGECESAIREDICVLAKGRRDLIVGSSSGGTANPPGARPADGAAIAPYFAAAIIVNDALYPVNQKFKFDLLVSSLHILAVNKCVGPAANHIVTTREMCQAPLLITF